MANYSTGELAKKVGVSIRTIQYYDRRQLLSLLNFQKRVDVFTPTMN